MKEDEPWAVIFRPNPIGTIIVVLVCACSAIGGIVIPYYDSMDLFCPGLFFSIMALFLGISALVGGVTISVSVSEIGIVKRSWQGREWDVLWKDVIKWTVRNECNDSKRVIIELQRPGANNSECVSIWDNEVTSKGIEAFIAQLNSIVPNLAADPQVK